MMPTSPKLLLLFGTVLLFFGSTVGGVVAQPATISPAFDKMLHGLLTFSVPTITPNELKKLQATRPLLLLDAREAKEYKVSHIAGALNVGYDHFDPAATDKLLAKAATDPRYSKNATVVVYCSVGYRSEKIGEKLGAMGYTHVYNLYGSIFEWVNEGNAVVDAKGKPTPYVHAYNPAWGVWLTKGKKTYQNP